VRTGTAAYNYSYTLDNAGNRSTWTDNTHSTSVSYTYDNANRMTAAGSYTYGYDADGNRTGVTLSGSMTTSTFDYEDRLTGIGANVAYSYIGAGTDRYNKTVSGTTTQFLYDSGSVDEEMQGATVTADYSAAAEKLSGALYWMLQDGQGSTRQLLSSSQATVAAYTTDAYGNSVSSSGTAANPFQWNGGIGYYSDSESGLQKVGARYYEPATGRWISQDSLLIVGSAADSQALNR
jgi:RHS repeat-associated protein